jgi:hypothetical protein
MLGLDLPGLRQTVGRLRRIQCAPGGGASIQVICPREEDGITHVAETKRKIRKLEQDCRSVLGNGSALPPALQSLQRFTRRSVKIIRNQRMFLFLPPPWSRKRKGKALGQVYATP